MTGTLYRPPALVLLLLATATLCARDQSSSQAGNDAQSNTRQPARKRQVKGISNFGEVTPNLFRGAHPSPEGFQSLARMGVSIIVDARGGQSESEGKEVSRMGLQYVAIPWQCYFPKDEVFARFLKLLRDNPDKKIFVHCRLGNDRTGMMVAAYRMAEQGWTADEAMREMVQFGYSGVHHYLICPRVASYEKDFPDHLKKNPVFQEFRSSSQSGKP